MEILYCRFNGMSLFPIHKTLLTLSSQRPSFCPIHNLCPDSVLQLPSAVRSRGIDVGAVTLLESSDGKLLLTRRASHLSIFPGVWVPPGESTCMCVYLVQCVLTVLHCPYICIHPHKQGSLHYATGTVPLADLLHKAGE